MTSNFQDLFILHNPYQIQLMEQFVQFIYPQPENHLKAPLIHIGWSETPVQLSSNQQIFNPPLQIFPFNNLDIWHDQIFFEYCNNNFTPVDRHRFLSFIAGFKETMMVPSFDKTDEAILNFFNRISIDSVESVLLNQNLLSKSRSNCSRTMKEAIKKEKRMKRIEKALSRIQLQSKVTLFGLSKRLRIPYHHLVEYKQLSNETIHAEPKIDLICPKWNIDSHDINLFDAFFNSIKGSSPNLCSIHQQFIRQFPKFSDLPKSTFYLTFMKSRGIKHKRIKYVKLEKYPEDIQMARNLFMRMFLHLSFNSEHIYFFDECSFELNHKNDRAFDQKGVQPTTETKLYPISVRLLLITSFTKVECFLMTNKSTFGSTIYRTITEFFMRKLSTNNDCGSRLFLVLDNAKKNRVDDIKNLSKHSQICLVYIVPNSPYLNFIESVFLVLKKKVYSRPFEERYVLLLGIQSISLSG